jgi:pyridoxal phosphate enzyme (YggS family)
MIKENIEIIRGRIAEVCARIKVDPDKITVICVTKGRPVSQIQEAVSLGLKHIGENRVQEALVKYKQIPDVKWHMVGHLQSNKVKDALEIFDLIHSVDSISLAQEINKQAVNINKTQNILLEVKTSPEVRKFGFKPEILEEVCGEISKFQNIKIKGLMTIAPLLDQANEARPYFSKLRQLRDQLDSGWLLSMGMSTDFEVAIEEGADMIRVGRKIFEG